MDAERERKFKVALSHWQQVASLHAVLEEECRLKHGQAFLASEAKTEAARKAEADIATSGVRFKRNAEEVRRDAAYHEVIFYRGNAGEAQR